MQESDIIFQVIPLLSNYLTNPEKSDNKAKKWAFFMRTNWIVPIMYEIIFTAQRWRLILFDGSICRFVKIEQIRWALMRRKYKVACEQPLTLSLKGHSVWKQKSQPDVKRGENTPSPHSYTAKSEINVFVSRKKPWCKYSNNLFTNIRLLQLWAKKPSPNIEVSIKYNN